MSEPTAMSYNRNGLDYRSKDVQLYSPQGQALQLNKDKANVDYPKSQLLP